MKLNELEIVNENSSRYPTVHALGQTKVHRTIQQNTFCHDPQGHTLCITTSYTNIFFKLKILIKRSSFILQFDLTLANIVLPVPGGPYMSTF